MTHDLAEEQLQEKKNIDGPPHTGSCESKYQETIM
jgi:hypothetical protein